MWLGLRARLDERGGKGMLVATLVMAGLAAFLLLVGYRRGGGEHVEGLRLALRMTVQILPLLVLSFVVAGMAQALLPREAISKWIGAQSGLRGVLLGALAGGLLPGGPYVILPLLAGLIRAGASVGTAVAFITGWALWSLSRLPAEVGIVGWKFALVRLTSVLLFPPLAGLAAQALFGWVKL